MKNAAIPVIAILLLLLARGSTAGSTNTHVIDTPNEFEYAVRVSPDNQSLSTGYVVSFPPGSNQHSLAIYDIDGTNRTVLVNTGLFGGGNSSWSPDSTRLVFDKTRFSAAQGIYLISRDGTGQVLLYNSPSGRMPVRPDWSPTGDWIAFEQRALSGSSVEEVWLIRPDGTGLHKITGTSSARTPRFSPDGTRIAFIRTIATNHLQVWTMKIDGTDQQAVTPTARRVQGDTALGWSPDGSELVYTNFVTATSTWEVRAIGTDGSNDRLLTELVNPTGVSCTWAPDGRIYYMDDADIYVLAEDIVPPTGAATADPATLWPPNHKYVDVEITIGVSDDCDDAPVWRFVSAESNEPDNGNGDGNTVNDIVQVDDTRFRLRAERSGQGSGRVYTITYEAEDASGNTSTFSAEVTVPKSQGE